MTATCGSCQGRIARITVRYDTARLHNYSFILEVIMDKSVTTWRVYQDGAPQGDPEVKKIEL
jgi:hypothetical protein